jgi:hypothetical protein
MGPYSGQNDWRANNCLGPHKGLLNRALECTGAATSGADASIKLRYAA